MNDETRLRTLLQAAVPDDASSLDPQAVGTAARRARHRNRLITLGAAAATVAVIGTVAVVATDGPETDRAAEDPTTTAPYDAPACPATLPEVADANTTTGDLDGVVSVRLCPDLAPEGMTDPMSEDDARAIRAGMDALVWDIDRFRAEAAALPEGIDASCAYASVMSTRQSLQFSLGDRTILVSTQLCGEVEVEGHRVDGAALASVYLAALDRQRDSLNYRREYTGPITCGQVVAAQMPARPGRERLVAAVYCPPQSDAVPLDDDQLEALDIAWQNPGEIAEDLNEFGENTCANLDYASGNLLVTTDRGDIVWLTESPCGFIVWSSSWQPGKSLAVPTTLADLGLD